MIVYLNMLLTIFFLSIAIKNLWPQKMSLQAYGVLCIVLAVAAVPVTFSSYMQYGLFSILVAVCIYGLVAYRDTRPQNISMGLLGCILTVVIDNLLAGVFLAAPCVNTGNTVSVSLRRTRPHRIALFCYPILRETDKKGIVVFQKNMGNTAGVVFP